MPTERFAAESMVPQKQFLRVRNVSKRFGGVVALDDVSFDVGAGEICGLIGPNGSGKTTLFNCISGIYRCDDGDILLNGRSLVRLASHKIATLGVGRTFQNLAVFPTMSVRDNILVGAHGGEPPSFVGDILRLPGATRQGHALQQDVSELIALLDLRDVEDRTVGGLPFAVQKRIELARALASRPKLLLLDEPAGGLSHLEVDGLCDLIKRIRTQFDLAVLLVEHHMNLVMRVSDRVVALDFGRRIAAGSPESVQVNPDVIRGYLGSAQHADAP
jgi:branched-chain amino acid transport system ATP-binding protein